MGEPADPADSIRFRLTQLLQCLGNIRAAIGHRVGVDILAEIGLAIPFSPTISSIKSGHDTSCQG